MREVPGGGAGRHCLGYVAAIGALILLTTTPLSASPVTKKLATALAHLQETPSDTGVQRAYLAAFPKSFKNFSDIFGYDHIQEAENTYENSTNYIDALFQCGDALPTETLALVAGIDRNGKWEADAIEGLQYGTAALAERHPAEFGHQLELMPAKDRRGVMRFLLDGPVPFKQAKTMSPIAGKLRSAGYDELAAEFEAMVKATAVRPAWH